jgi:hypothetical protein
LDGLLENLINEMAMAMGSGFTGPRPGISWIGAVQTIFDASILV